MSTEDARKPDYGALPLLSDGNPNFGELMADLRLLWIRWKHTSGTDQQNSLDNHGTLEAALDGTRASTRRMCMEDAERLIEKYGGSIE